MSFISEKKKLKNFPGGCLGPQIRSLHQPPDQRSLEGGHACEKGEGDCGVKEGSGLPSSFSPPASGSATSEGDAGPHRSDEKSQDERPRTRKIDVTPTEERGQIGPNLKKAKQEEAQAVQRAEESVSVVVTQQQNNQPGKTPAATAGEGSSASAAAPRPRYPPYPKSGKAKDVRKWSKECDKVNEMIRELDDLDYDIPTMTAPKDPGTTKAVQSSKDKMVVLRAARSIVSVAYIMDDGQRLPRCTIVVTYSRLVCKNGRKLDPLPKGGNGGMVIDHNGEVRGMAVYWSPYPAVISISTIVACVNMFTQFNRVARPLLGLSLRTIALLDVQLQEDISDIGIDGGFVVDEVYYSDAEKLGIKCGNVIISINGQDALTLPELEDYLLSLGWNYLKDESICMKDLKLRVCDLKTGVKRDVTLPVTFYDKSDAVEWI